MRHLILICFMLTGPLALADSIYQSTAPDGSVVFSDNPSEGAVEIKLKPLTTYSAKEAVSKNKATKNTAANADPSTKDAGDYKVFIITNPANDATLPTGAAGNITIQTKLEPTLRVKKGHRLSLLVDGTQLDHATSTSSIGLSNLDRGSHSIRAVIVNERGDIVQLSSNSVTLHVKRASIFAPANPRNPANNPPRVTP